jgi:hypothetical protein
MPRAPSLDPAGSGGPTLYPRSSSRENAVSGKKQHPRDTAKIAKKGPFFFKKTMDFGQITGKID